MCVNPKNPETPYEPLPLHRCGRRRHRRPDGGPGPGRARPPRHGVRSRRAAAPAGRGHQPAAACGARVRRPGFAARAGSHGRAHARAGVRQPARANHLRRSAWPCRGQQPSAAQHSPRSPADAPVGRGRAAPGPGPGAHRRARGGCARNSQRRSGRDPARRRHAQRAGLRHPGGGRRHPLGAAPAVLPRRGGPALERHDDVARHHAGAALSGRPHHGAGRSPAGEVRGLPDRAGAPRRPAAHQLDLRPPPARRRVWRRPHGPQPRGLEQARLAGRPAAHFRQLALCLARRARADPCGRADPRMAHGGPRPPAALAPWPHHAAGRCGAPDVPHRLERCDAGHSGRSRAGRCAGRPCQHHRRAECL